jgi:hypothetical protein
MDPSIDISITLPKPRRLNGNQFQALYKTNIIPKLQVSLNVPSSPELAIVSCDESTQTSVTEVVWHLIAFSNVPSKSTSST